MIRLQTTDIAHGGEAVARLEGKAHFVAGALPGEVVEGRIIRDKGSWARVELARVVEASPDRVEPPCRHFGECGGCQWQYAAHAAQLEWKRRIVEGQLRHLGRIDDPAVRETASPSGPFGYRNRMDFAVADGRPALRRGGSRDPVPVPACLLMEPTLEAVYRRIGSLGGATSLTLRAAAATGEALVVIRGAVPPGIEDWGCAVSHRTRDGLEALVGGGVFHEEVAGFRFRITGDAFFQNNTAGAAALVSLVGEAADPRPDDTLLDGFAGGGLFGIAVGRRAARVTAVEADQTAAVDFAHNAARAGIDHRLFNVDFPAGLSAVKDPWDVAVVDPPRDGLGAAGVDGLTACEPRRIAYVSCDPASLARDARLLGAAGYRLEWAAPVDLFPQTFHVETVARFVRR